MTELNSAARKSLEVAGIDPAEWVRTGGSWTGSPSADGQWHGDQCGCTDSRCIGYHHARDEDCGCLPVLISSYQRNRQAARIWNRYRDAVDNDDQGGYQDAWDQAEAWVRRHHPQAESFSLDTAVNGMAGISITVHPDREPVEGPATTKIGEDEYRELVWAANENPWDTWSRRDVRLDDPPAS